MSRKTRKLKEKIERIRKDVMYHLSNVRILLNNPSLIQVEELKFQYGFFPVRETISGSVRKIERIKDEVKNENVVAEGVSFGTFSGEEHKFPKEELESIEYKLSNYAPVNVVDDKKFYGVKDGKPTEKNYLSEKEMLFDLPAGVEGWRSFIINGILVHAPDDKRPEDWTKFIETLKNLPVCTFEKQDKPNEFIVEKDVKLGENYVGDVKFQKSELLDKSWLEVKKEAARKEAETLTKQTDVNKDGATGYNPVYSPEHLESKKKLFEFAAEKFKECVDQTFNAGLKKESDDQWVLVKVKEGSIIIPPGSEIPTMVKGMPRQDIVRVGDLKKRADALEKCTDQECKPIGELPKTLESLDKIYSFIGLREKSAITNGNKDIIFMKTNNYLNSGRVGYFNTQKPNLMYSPFEMLSDWKSNYVKPLD